MRISVHSSKKRINKRLYQQAAELAQRPYSYTIVRSGYGYYMANVFGLPGCKTDGKTMAEAKQNMEIAKTDYIYVLLSIGQPIPETSCLDNHIIIDCAV